MKYRVRIDDRWYEVEITDTGARPVRTLVDGEVIEVWPEEVNSADKTGLPAALQTMQKNEVRPLAGESRKPVQAKGGNGASPAAALGPQKVLRAPIPGVVISIAIQPEDEVLAGQELFVLEAMKMKNSIRASRAGKIASVGVSVGQHVKHNQVLVEYSR
jgi:biotin carboxyl carrier protein